MIFQVLLSVLVLATATTVGGIIIPTGDSDSNIIRMFVAYCPTDFTGAGAIVDVDPITANWTIKAHVKLPSEVFGCVADYSPKYDFDHKDPNTLWFDFTSDDGFFLAVDTRFGNTTKVSSGDLFFTGFLNFKYIASDNKLQGLSGTVTENGFCFDGCIAYGHQDIVGRPRYVQEGLLPFKEVPDDTSVINWEKGTYHFQAAYDLRDTPCAPTQSDQCLLSVNMSNGKMLSSTYTPHYDVFKFGRHVRPGGNVSAFMVGFNTFCNASDETSYVFGKVNLETATGYPTGCVNQSVVIQTDEWISSNSLDDKWFATGSGNGDGDDPQLLVFDAETAAVKTQSELHGLASALRAKMGLIFIWALEFVEKASPAV